MKQQGLTILESLNRICWIRGCGDETTEKPWALSKLLQLPLELLLLILAALPPESVVAVRLTCKGLLQLRSSIGGEKTDGKTAKDALDKQRLLLLLEKDLPDYIVCYDCNKLYRWKMGGISEHALRYTCPARNHGSPHSSAAALCRLCYNWSRIYRETRDLILRAHLRGADYGIPISTITHEDTSNDCCDLQSRVSAKLRPKIVSGSLMLQRSEEFVVDSSLSLADQLEALGVCACRHVYHSLSSVARCGIQHILDDNTHRALSKPASGWKCQGLFRCSFCATDFRVHVAIASTQELSIQVTSWQDLGRGPDCNSAQDALFRYSESREADTQVRNLEQRYRDESQRVARGAYDAGNRRRANPVAQHYSGYGPQAKSFGMQLPDF